jgi:hypothetical protein
MSTNDVPQKPLPKTKPETLAKARVASSLYYAKHRDAILAKRKKAWVENPEPLREILKTSYRRYRENRKEKQREYYQRRQIYRGIAEREIGRSLLKGEHVHHIDCDHDNNSPENLHVISASEHAKAHTSLNALAKGLIADGIVEYDRATKSYRRRN